MGIISKKVQFGWYGSCETMKNCSGLLLDGTLSTSDSGDDRSKLSAIVRVSNVQGHVGNVFEKFTPYNKNKEGLFNKIISSGKSFDHFFNNNFQELDCGRGYIVVSRGAVQDFDIKDFHISGQDGYISSTCADQLYCTQLGNLIYDVSPQSNVSDQENGVISSGIAYVGKLSVPTPSATSSSTPIAVDLLHNNQLIGHITFTGNIDSGSMIYLNVTTGQFVDKCLSGEISNNVCILKE
jgi:hypothetical protein